MVGRPFRRVGKHSRMIRRSSRGSRGPSVGRKALPNGWEWSVDSPGAPGVVRRPFQRVGKHSRIIRRSSRGVERPFDGSEGPSKGMGVVGRLSRSAGSGREAIPEGRERLGSPPKGPGVVRDTQGGSEGPSGGSGGSLEGQKASPEGWEWSVGPLGVPRVVGRPSRRARSGQ